MRLGLISCLCSLCGFIGGFVCLGAGFILYTQFENIFGTTVRNQMLLDDSVYWWYDIWLKPPGREQLTVHIFQVENAAAWRKNPARTRPQLRVTGPFVFRVQRIKEKVNFTSEEHTQIGYDERTTYHFDELLSYESLEEKATVANAELMILNPFILAMTRRASAVARISKSLNATINQILRLYEANLFIERTVERIIFGPSSGEKGSAGGGGGVSPLPTMPEGTEGSGDAEFDKTMGNESISLARLSQGRSGSLQAASTLEGIEDEATKEILKLYDKISPYLEKLGVDVSPYTLLAAQLGREVSQPQVSPKSSRLQAANSEYRFNSMLAFFQNNSLQKFDLFTGKSDKSTNGQILRWNNQNKMDAWFSRSCNAINGTDGRQFGPFVHERRLYEFDPKVCRSVPFQMREQGVTKEEGINYFRYTRALDFMQSPVKYTPNGCFCRWWNPKGRGKDLALKNKRCNYDGILDLGTCYSGTANGALLDEGTANGTGTPHSSAPVILSNPHFSGPITKSITREVGGLTPDVKAYGSHVDVEPVSGIVLERTSRMQFNLHFRPLPLSLRSNRTLRELIIPLFWFEETWQLSPDHQNHIKYFFVYPLKYQEMAIFGLIGGGVVLLLFGSLCFCFCCCANKKKGATTGSAGKSRSNGKVSPTQSQEPFVTEVPDNGIAPLDPYDEENEQMMMDEGPIASFANQWGTQGPPNGVRGGPGGRPIQGAGGGNYPPPPDGAYADDQMMLDDSEEQMMMMQQRNGHIRMPANPNQAYFDNENYVDDGTFQQQQAHAQMMMRQNGGGSPLQPLPPPPPRIGQMTQMVGRIPLQAQQQQANGYAGQVAPQYPLERLKRNMPQKQSASTYSMRTLQPQGRGGGQQQQMNGQMQQQQQQQQQAPNQRQRWNDQPPAESYDAMGNDDYDYFYNGGGGDEGKAVPGLEGTEEDPYYGNYRGDSGNDSWHGSSGQTETANGAGGGAGAVGYYETYDEYGRARPPPTEPGIEIYQNNPYGGGGRGGPPPPPGNGRGGGGNAHDNLLAEIRNGTKLRKTSSPKELQSGLQLEDLIQATSTAVVQKVLEHLERTQAIPRPPPPPPEPKSLDLELLTRIITNSPAAAAAGGYQPRPTTNNIVININGSPQPGSGGGHPFADPQMMGYLQSLMYPGFQQQQPQLPALSYQQQMALMSLLQGGAGMGYPQIGYGQNGYPQTGYPQPAYTQPGFTSSLGSVIQQQPSPLMPIGYPTYASTQNMQGAYYTSGGMMQDPRSQVGPNSGQPMASQSVAIQETAMLMQQQQPQSQQQSQQQYVYQRMFEARSNLDSERENPPVQNDSQMTMLTMPPPLDEPPKVESPASSVATATEITLPPPPNYSVTRQPAEPLASVDTSGQGTLGTPDSIRFFGPYRAYQPPDLTPKSQVRIRNRTTSTRQTNGWDSSFDDDDDDEEFDGQANGKQEKKYL